MGDRYVGKIKCPYCKKETEYLYNDEWGRSQVCEHCDKDFEMDMKLFVKGEQDE